VTHMLAKKGKDEKEERGGANDHVEFIGFKGGKR